MVSVSNILNRQQYTTSSQPTQDKLVSSSDFYFNFLLTFVGLNQISTNTETCPPEDQMVMIF